MGVLVTCTGERTPRASRNGVGRAHMRKHRAEATFLELPSRHGLDIAHLHTPSFLRPRFYFPLLGRLSSSACAPNVENDITRGSARAEDPFAVRWPDAETGCGRTATRRQWEEGGMYRVLEECASQEDGARAVVCTGEPQRICAGGTRVYWQRNPKMF